MKDDRRDEVDAVLQALGRAQAPEGLEARVVQGLAARMDAELAAARVARGAWWRGAAAGFAAAGFAAGVVMLGGHLVRGRESAGMTAAARVTVVGQRAQRSAVVDARDLNDRREPCTGAPVLRVASVGSEQRLGAVRIEGASKGTGILASPLTAEERGLVRLAQSGDLKELATLNPEVRERLEAEDAAQFQSFFAEKSKPAVAADPATAATAAGESSTGNAAALEPAAGERVTSDPAAESSAGENQ